MPAYNRGELRKRRTIPEQRKKYGKMENRVDAISRLKEIKANKKEQKELTELVKGRNKDEFHFQYHSIGPGMVKDVKLPLPLLQRSLRYVDSEIKRSERKCRNGMVRARVNQHIKFDDNGEAFKQEVAAGKKNDLDSNEECFSEEGSASDEESGVEEEPVYNSDSSADNSEVEIKNNISENTPTASEVYGEYLKALIEKRIQIIKKIAAYKKK